MEDRNGSAKRERIVLLTQFFPPETGAGAKRLGPMAESLSRRHAVLVVTLKPSYPSPKEYEGVDLEDHDRGKRYDVKRTFTFPPHAGSLVIRTLREHVMALGLMLRALPEPADMVVVSSPSMFLGPAGLILARLKGAKFVWDVRDITWGYAMNAPGVSSVMALAARALERYMLHTLRRADLTIGASKGITHTLLRGGVKTANAVTVPNGISTKVLEDIELATEKKVEKQRPTVAYAGLIGYNQGLGTLLDVARLLPFVDFVLAGDGPELNSLKRRSESLNLRNVSFRGYLNKERLLEVYRNSDVLFAQARSTPTIDATMVPVKLFEYMATGRPIVYAGRGIAVDLLREAGCAVTVPPENSEEISDAIESLLQAPERMHSLGIKGKSFVQSNYHREKLMDGLAQALTDGLASPNYPHHVSRR